MAVSVVFLLLPFCLAFAAFTDLFTMTIPNRISIILVCSFLIVAPLSGMTVGTVGSGLLAAIAVFSGCFALFALNVMGGGDAKLLTASALWFGLNSSLTLFLISVALVGGVLTLAILFLRSKSENIVATGIPVPDSLLVAQKVPYGIAIAIGGLLTYPETPIVQAAIRSLL
ncbi:prepilin peptidase CpaA [Agrobacterium larrymoorei]|uniref:Prepilin peptidase CpaA n=1 Tax=Agrobacterium larrymoorei TaxID=160699 RepID=A0AAJ2ET44_9HYPH|nr:prepilin peptidase [Agrobacterium larrymoorei]MDR6103840.1 prepilin peptidase CpaA [Agrobacterium larrymoorei]